MYNKKENIEKVKSIMEIHAGHHWIANFGGFVVNMDTLITMWIVMGLLLLLAFFTTRRLSIVPSKLQAVMENIMSFFWGLVEPMGKDGKKHVPLLASLFLFILSANLIGQIPWRLYKLPQGEFASPTNDINMTAAMAIVVLIYYISAGVAQKGLKYFLHYFKPIPIMAPLNILEDVIRPLSLSVRLFANILAGEILIMVVLGLGGLLAEFLITKFGLFSTILAPITALFPLPFMFFEVFVAFVQALVFTLLSTAYLSIAVEKNH